jgi:hypothetical protein
MKPIVHGLEAVYGEQIEFVYVNIDDPSSAGAKETYGFRYQPQFVLVDGNGEVIKQWQGRVEAAEFEEAFATVVE